MAVEQRPVKNQIAGLKLCDLSIALGSEQGCLKKVFVNDKSIHLSPIGFG